MHIFFFFFCKTKFNDTVPRPGLAHHTTIDPHPGTVGHGDNGLQVSGTGHDFAVQKRK